MAAKLGAALGEHPTALQQRVAAAVSVVYAIFVEGVIFRELTWRKLFAVTERAAISTAIISTVTAPVPAITISTVTAPAIISISAQAGSPASRA